MLPYIAYIRILWVIQHHLSIEQFSCIFHLYQLWIVCNLVVFKKVKIHSRTFQLIQWLTARHSLTRTLIWWFPEIGVTPVLIDFHRIFHKPSIFGNLPLMETLNILPFRVFFLWLTLCLRALKPPETSGQAFVQPESRSPAFFCVPFWMRSVSPTEFPSVSPAFRFNTFGDFHSHGGTPSSLDGL